MAWQDNLQTASWRGISFGVMDSEVRRGRRVAVHEYPYRDIVWVEDLGRATRRYGFRGFYVGDDCYQVEQQMLAAAEVKGVGTLVHPSLGSVQVNLIEFSSGQRRELGRVVEFQFGFIEGAAAANFPSAANATQDSVTSAAADADSASQGDFFDRAGAAIATGAASIRQAASTVQGYVSEGLSVVHDASRLVNSVNGLGSLVGVNFGLGRYAGGSLGATGGLGPVLSTVVSIPSTLGRVEAGATAAIGNAISLGTAVEKAGSSLGQLAEAL